MIVDPIFSQAFPVPVLSILQAGDQLEGGDMSTDTYVEGVCTPSRSSSPISIYYHYGRLPLEPNKTFQFPTFENGQMFIHVVPYAKRHPELERRAPSPDPVTAMVQKNIRERNEAARKWSAARQEARLARAKAILDKNCCSSGRWEHVRMRVSQHSTVSTSAIWTDGPSSHLDEYTSRC